MVGFAIVGLAIATLIHVYLWKRLVRDTTRSARWRRLGGLAVLAASLLLVANLTLADRLPRAVEPWLAWPGQLWLVIMMYLILILAALELPVLIAEVDGTPLYVTNGTGFFGAPVRVGADPDITLITLRAP